MMTQQQVLAQLTGLFLCLLPVVSVAEPLDLRTLGLDKTKIPELYVTNSKKGKEPILLTFSSIQPSKLIITTKANALTLYKKETNAEEKSVFKVAHQIKIPATAKGIMLLAWTSDTKQRFLAIDDHFSAAKADEWILINAGNKTVAFQVGAKTKPVAIEPNSVKTFKVKAPPGTGAAILAKANIDQEVKTIYSTYWPMYTGQRLVVIITSQGKKIRVRPIFDKILTTKPDEPE